MDNYIIKHWNEKVKPEDTVYILGDISFYGLSKTVEIVSQLNGKKHLIAGNHDKLIKQKTFKSLFETISERETIYVNETKIVLDHYPSICYNGHFNHAVHLYGHVHNTFEEQIVRNAIYDMTVNYNRPMRMYNCGCMMPWMNYEPQTWQDIEDGCREYYKVKNEKKA